MANNDYNVGEDFDSIFEDSGSVSRSEAKKLVREEFQKVLADVNTFSAQAQAGQQAAIREVTVAHPDFEGRRSRMLAVLQEIPLLRDAVASAESNPQLSNALPQIYEAVYKASFAPADNTAAPASEPNRGNRSASDTDLSDEGTQYQAALASQRVDLSPANRKVLIAELERKGVGDIEF